MKQYTFQSTAANAGPFKSLTNSKQIREHSKAQRDIFLFPQVFLGCDCQAASSFMSMAVIPADSYSFFTDPPVVSSSKTCQQEILVAILCSVTFSCNDLMHMKILCFCRGIY